MLGRHRVVSVIKGKGEKRPQRSTLLLSVACKFLLSLISLLQPHQRIVELKVSLAENANPLLWLAKSLAMPGFARQWDADLKVRLLCSWQVQTLGTEQANRQSRAWHSSVCLQSNHYRCTQKAKQSKSRPTPGCMRCCPKTSEKDKNKTWEEVKL